MLKIKKKTIELSALPDLSDYIKNEVIRNFIIVVLATSFMITFPRLELILPYILMVGILCGTTYHKYYLITRDKLLYITGFFYETEDNDDFLSRFSKIKRTSLYTQQDGLNYKIFIQRKYRKRYNQKNLTVYALPQTVYQEQFHITISSPFFITVNK